MPATRKRKIVLLLAGIAAVAVALAVTYWLRGSEPQINLPKTVEEGIKTLATPEFTQLPDYRQEAYRKEVKRLIAALPEPERLALITKYRGNPVMQKGFVQLRFNPLKMATDEYYKAPPEQRTAMVDKFIDRMETVRKLSGLLRGGNANGDAGAAGPGGAQPGRVPGLPFMSDAQRKAMFRERFEKQIQEGDPQDTARMMEFFKHVQLRRAERHMPEM